ENLTGHLFYIKKWKACVGDTKALNVASCFTNESMFSTINQKAGRERGGRRERAGCRGRREA
uniref:Uncharacterized protein n=1 Tax=Oreochromis niloticus TaxID=8128 RepID=A0A669DVL3_ORENI